MSISKKSYDEDLYCFHCQSMFESVPITLFPCGWVICSHHFGNPMKKFQCNMCPTIHIVDAEKCIKTKPMEIKYLKHTIEKSLKEFEREIDKMEMIKKDPVHYLDEFFTETINKIDLVRELTKQEIDLYFDNLHKRIVSAKESYQTSIDENNDFKIFSCEDMLKDKEFFMDEFVILNDAKNSFDPLNELRNKIREKRTTVKKVIDSLTDYKKYDLKYGYLNEYFFSQIRKIEIMPIKNEIDLDRKESMTAPKIPFPLPNFKDSILEFSFCSDKDRKIKIPNRRISVNQDNKK